MKLHFLDRASYKDYSFTVRNNKYPYFLKIWHYHQELELVLIKKSSGTRFIGDSIAKFDAGEVILIGENLPHMWLNDDIYFHSSSNKIAEAIAIHFSKDFLGKEFFCAPELRQVNEMMEKAKFGLKFIDLHYTTIEKIKMLENRTGLKKLISFFEILNELSNHQMKLTLSSEGFVKSFSKTSNEKNSESMDKVYEYIFKNLTSPILLTDVAAVANMNPSAFSRYFKRINRKTFKEYVNELRIGYACKLLTENQYNITRICYESGYNNISNFNRQFKKITGKSPSSYLKKHKTQTA